MSRTKAEVIKSIQEFQIIECAIFESKVIDEMEHAGLQIQIINLLKRVEVSPTQEYKVE